mgnify:CR=1 FL=1
MIKKGLVQVISLLTAIDYVLLILIDSVLITYVKGYQSTGDYFLPNVLFFLATYTLCWNGLKYGWSQLLPYFMLATGIFFPLILINTIGNFYLGLSPELETFYRDHYCNEIHGDLLCGEALAHLAFSGVIRALPLLIIIPTIFYCFYQINLFGIQDDSSSA